jgi:cytochrome P450
MRLCPPAPTNIPRLVGVGGITVLNTHYPGGVCIGVPNFTLFRNATYFEEPHAYIPERWIVDPDTHNEESVKRAYSAFKPFSIGPRHCIAQRLAIKEISYVVAKLVYQFEFEVVGRCGTLEENVLPDSKGYVGLRQLDVFTSLEQGPRMRFWPRAPKRNGGAE